MSMTHYHCKTPDCKKFYVTTNPDYQSDLDYQVYCFDCSEEWGENMSEFEYRRIMQITDEQIDKHNREFAVGDRLDKQTE
jgi:hypothetical protein